jgi:O-methyltransferase domain/Dimerisation domain
LSDRHFSAEKQPAAIPAHVQLMHMATGCWISQLVSTAANLSIADHLAGGPKSASDIAEAVRCNPLALHRFMRALANFGILTRVGEQKFALTPLGEALKSGAPGAARSTVLMTAGPLVWKCFEQLQYSVETGQTAMEKIFGLPLFDYLAQHPELASQFSEAMVGIHSAEPAAVAASYDFSALEVIVDVGGATGNLLAHIVARYPQCRGVLYDRPHVVADAPAFLRKKGVENRVRIECGDFFTSAPAGGDAYILSHIIHDWTEEQCLTILSRCREAMKPGAKLLIVEFVLPEGNEPHIGKLLDMTMLVVTGGEERTANEYRTLLARAGLTITRVVPTDSDVSIVEAEIRNEQR